jgi:hypothetical protein
VSRPLGRKLRQDEGHEDPAAATAANQLPLSAGEERTMLDFVSILLQWLGLTPDDGTWNQAPDSPPLATPSGTGETPEANSPDLGAIINPDG